MIAKACKPITQKMAVATVRRRFSQGSSHSSGFYSTKFSPNYFVQTSVDDRRWRRLLNSPIEQDSLGESQKSAAVGETRTKSDSKGDEKAVAVSDSWLTDMERELHKILQSSWDVWFFLIVYFYF